MTRVACRRIAANGLEFNVADAGHGPVVLLVHGFPDCHDVWRHQIPVLVAAGYRVIAPDMRGCGDSDAPRGRAHYTLDLLVRDLGSLLDALEIRRVRLLAHDWGAVVGWQFCMRHPDRVDRYMALAVGHPTAYGSAGLAQKLKGWYVLFLQLTGFAEWALRFGNWWLFRAITRYDAEFAGWQARLARPGRLTAAINYYRANLRLIWPRAWPHVRVPVLGVCSDGDRFLTESQMVDSGRHVDGTWRCERIRGANHWMQLTAPDRVNELMLDYFR